MRRIRTIILTIFGIFTLLSIYLVLNIQFSFSFEDFFPNDDPDLAFYQEFIEDFETDINFLLVAVERKEGVFEKTFLTRFNDFTLKAQELPFVKSAQSLTQVSYPVKTPFGLSTIPAIHLDQPHRYSKDSLRILEDDRFKGNLISEDATSLVVAIKTQDSVYLEESEILMTSLEKLVQTYNFENHYILGPAYFQKEMVAMQKREVLFSALISAFLVSLVMFWIFRKPWGIFISLISIGLGLLFFLAALSALGRPLNAMAALYPVLMIIVGTSDVIHIMSKYIDELKKGHRKRKAIEIAIREIGLATLLTSVTTAIGFATLLTSRIGPIRDFGLNAALGVMIAYTTVIFFTTSLLSIFEKEQLIKFGRGEAFWDKLMRKTYALGLNQSRKVVWIILGTIIISFWGISLVTTNYQIASNLPKGEKITEDFNYFEKKFAGFRPFEIAVFSNSGKAIETFESINEIAKLESRLEEIPGIEGVNSITTLYKSVHQMMNQNKKEFYTLPASQETFEKYKKLTKRIPASSKNVLLSKDGNKARITAKAKDMGADQLGLQEAELTDWINTNIDTSKLSFQQTGMGLIMDKNAQYIRTNLLQGLGLAIFVISLLMVVLFRDWRMIIISIIPNVLPLIMAGALIGFLGIELEAGVAIVFAIVFGIAVDDTIHFLSKFKLLRDRGNSVEDSLLITFTETGKAVCLTSLILFFGFLVMLFSIHPPSVTIGLLISLTLVTALLSDLFLLPVLIRWLIK